MKPTQTYTGLGILSLVMWSFTVLLVAWLKNIPAFEIMFLAFFSGFLMLSSAQLYNREDIKAYWRRPFSDYAFWLAGAGVYTIMFYFAVKMIPVFEANALNYLWPILLVIFSSLLQKTPLTLNVISGAFAGFLGTILVILPAREDISFSGLHWGHALALGCGFTWAGYSALTRGRDYPAGFLTPIFFVFSLICLALHLAFEKTVMPNGIESLILIILGGSRVSYVLWDTAMKKGDVTLLASLSYFLPLVSTLWLMAFGFGPHRPMIAIGGAFIILGCLTVNGPRMFGVLAKRLKA